MKYKVKTKTSDGLEIEETYNTLDKFKHISALYAKVDFTPEEHAKILVDYFNSTCRPGEATREILKVMPFEKINGIEIGKELTEEERQLYDTLTKEVLELILSKSCNIGDAKKTQDNSLFSYMTDLDKFNSYLKRNEYRFVGICKAPWRKLQYKASKYRKEDYYLEFAIVLEDLEDFSKVWFHMGSNNVPYLFQNLLGYSYEEAHYKALDFVKLFGFKSY